MALFTHRLLHTIMLHTRSTKAKMLYFLTLLRSYKPRHWPAPQFAQLGLATLTSTLT